jgi:hypothetical protein
VFPLDNQITGYNHGKKAAGKKLHTLKNYIYIVAAVFAGTSWLAKCAICSAACPATVPRAGLPLSATRASPLVLLPARRPAVLRRAAPAAAAAIPRAAHHRELCGCCSGCGRLARQTATPAAAPRCLSARGPRSSEQLHGAAQLEFGKRMQSVPALKFADCAAGKSWGIHGGTRTVRLEAGASDAGRRSRGAGDRGAPTRMRPVSLRASHRAPVALRPHMPLPGLLPL